jgi:hypothetical protein
MLIPDQTRQSSPIKKKPHLSQLKPRRIQMQRTNKKMMAMNGSGRKNKPSKTLLLPILLMKLGSRCPALARITMT